MATAIEAASARIACALAAITDLVAVSNVDRAQCTMDVSPPDALSPGRKFSDFGIQDVQMPFFLDRLARCSPEASVKNTVNHWAVPSGTQINAVVGMLEAELLNISGWDGKCLSDECCE